MRGNCYTKIGVYVLTALLLGGSGTLPADQQQELLQLQERIRGLQRQLNQERDERDAERRRLERNERDIAARHRQLAELRDRTEAQSRRIAELDRQRELQDQRLAGQRENIARLARGSYLLQSNSYLKMIFNQEDPAELGRMLGYYRYLASARAQQVTQLQRSLAEAQALRQQLASEQAALRQSEAELLQQQDNLRVQQRRREELLVALEQRISSRAGELSRLKRDEKRLQRLLRDLREYLADLPADMGSGASFGKMRGRLALPVSAPIAARFGERKGGGGSSWQGILLNAAEGQTVRAVFRGRVAFADWLRGFGLLLILDHGDGYMSLYSHNQVLLKQVGDWVEMSEPIARVGNSGGLPRSGLYFEIRHNGKPRNPLRWCKTK